MKKIKINWEAIINPEKHPKLYKAYKWLENQWYHNKAAILCVAFFSFVIIFGLSQCMSKVEPDYKILLCVDKFLPTDVRSAMEVYFEQYAEDINGDGKTVVHVLDCTSGTDYDQYIANKTMLMGELQIGEAVLIIADESYYEYLTQKGDIFESDPCFNAKNGKALVLKGTDFENFIDITFDGYITEDMMLYKRQMDGTESGTTKKAQEAKVNNEALLKKLAENLK